LKCVPHLNLLMWRMFVGLTDISWALTLAMACTVAVDGHTCFLLVTAATNTYRKFHSGQDHELKAKEIGYQQCANQCRKHCSNWSWFMSSGPTACYTPPLRMIVTESASSYVFNNHTEHRHLLPTASVCSCC
jgi:hypothetical protein